MMRDDMIAAVQALTGRRVEAFLSDNLHDPMSPSRSSSWRPAQRRHQPSLTGTDRRACTRPGVAGLTCSAPAEPLVGRGRSPSTLPALRALRADPPVARDRRDSFRRPMASSGPMATSAAGERVVRVPPTPPRVRGKPDARACVDTR
jgi:hypothetical protein